MRTKVEKTNIKKKTGRNKVKRKVEGMRDKEKNKGGEMKGMEGKVGKC